MNRIRTAFALAALLSSSPALAQTAPITDRVYINANGGLVVSGRNFTGITHPVTFVEPATVNTTYQVKSAPGLEVTGGVRVWRSLTLGAGISRFGKSGHGDVGAQVPHPFYTNQLRSIAGDAGGLQRSETGVHVLAAWSVPLTPRTEMTISGGPSYFSVAQDVVADVTFDQSYPYDTATFTGAVKERETASAVGFNVGADVTYMLRRHVGVGGSVMFSQADVKLAAGGAKVRAGGAHVGGGLRLRF
jgi:hypothetical protein